MWDIIFGHFCWTDTGRFVLFCTILPWWYLFGKKNIIHGSERVCAVNVRYFERSDAMAIYHWIRWHHWMNHLLPLPPIRRKIEIVNWPERCRGIDRTNLYLFQPKECTFCCSARTLLGVHLYERETDFWKLEMVEIYNFKVLRKWKN